MFRPDRLAGLGGRGKAGRRKPRDYQLHHEPYAKELADAGILRTEQVDRILEAVEQAPHRLLLIGESGIGKSVLLAQLLQRVADRALYFSMDHPPAPATEPEALTLGGAVAPSLGPPVRTHWVAGFRHLAGRPGPTGMLGRAAAVDDITESLRIIAGRDERPVYLIIDGLNQAPIATELLDGLPEPLPKTLRLVASTQNIPFVLNTATAEGTQDWTRLPARELAHDVAAALLRAAWGRTGAATTAAPEIPPDIVDALNSRCRGLPMFLQPWSEWLRHLWQMHGGDLDAIRRQIAAAPNDPFPKDYQEKIEAALSGHRPAWLPAAALAVLALVGQPLDAEGVARGLRLLGPRFAAPNEAETADEAGPAIQVQSRDAIETLHRIGGFLRRQTSTGRQAWRLSHEQLGRWYLRELLSAEQRAAARAALVILGADPLADARPGDPLFSEWLNDLLDGGSERYTQLPPLNRLSVLERLREGVQWPDDAAEREHLRAVFLMGQGIARTDAGEMALGIRDGDEAVALLTELRQGLGTGFPDTWSNDLARAHTNRGVGHWNKGDADAAQADFDQTLAILEALRAHLGDAFPDYWAYILSSTYGNCGIVHSGKGALDAAQVDFDQALAILETLHTCLGDAFPDPWANDLAGAYMGRGVDHRRKGNQDVARADYDRSLAIHQALRMRLGDAFPASWANDLAGTYMNSAVTHGSNRDQNAAIADYDRSLAIREALRVRLDDAFPAPPAMAFT